jgi:AraC-like DNA-binding protein
MHAPQVERFRANISTTCFPAHAHEGYVVGVVHRGIQELSCQGVTHFAKAGSVIFLNPEEIHSAKAAESSGVTYETLHVPSSIVEELGHANFRFQQPVIHAPELARTFARAFTQLDSEIIENIWLEKLLEIVDLLVRVQSQSSERLLIEPDKRINHLLQYVEANIISPLNLKVLADQVGISQQHLIRCFKGALGVTPHDYIRARRVALAKRMLQECPPSEVAAFTGFADQSHLTRWLKACYGTTPNVYRRQLQNRRHEIPIHHGLDEKLFELAG